MTGPDKADLPDFPDLPVYPISLAVPARPEIAPSRLLGLAAPVDLSVAGEEDPGAALDLASDTGAQGNPPTPAAATPAGDDSGAVSAGSPRPDAHRRPVPGRDA